MKLPLLPLLLLSVMWLAPGLLKAQTTTPAKDSVSVAADSVPPAPVKKKFLPVPRKSLLYAIIPGGGQFYNRRYWKMPLVYGALGGMVYLIDRNQGYYKRLKTALELKLEDKPHEFSGTRIDNVNTLRTLRDQADKNTQLSYIGTVVVYALQGIEAYTDAHLMNFDISESLSLQVKPHFDTNPTTQLPAPGLGLRLNFSK